MARQLLGNWPWLAKTDQDLKVYINSVTTIFAAYSVEAAKQVLHPVHGIVGESERPPSPAALNQALKAFEDRQRAVARAAEWVIAETERRAAEKAHEEQIEADKRAFREKHKGRSLVDVFKDAVRP